MDDNFKSSLVAATKSRNSIWELTADYTIPPPPTDTLLEAPLYEVGLGQTFTPTSADVFDAWTGPRRLNGLDYHGPIFNLGTSIAYDGPRHCGCSTCEATAQPIHRKN